jgi:hypothetical protein
MKQFKGGASHKSSGSSGIVVDAGLHMALLLGLMHIFCVF